ncbi:MAG: SufD family Fe-S cluster assembly protein [Lachnospiraceae bacterium]|nr:SufD family Fe-S cluster assembly protein [Lachnospiraceae bacterium]
MDIIEKILLKEVANITELPIGAYNIRKDAAGSGRKTTKNIDIVTKKDKPGIDIIIKAGTPDETVYIPAIITKSGVDDLVYNDFYIGEGAIVTIIAGCGVNCNSSETSRHNGIHRFFVGKRAIVKYIEKHVGIGEGTGERIINPETYIEAGEDSYVEMETTQIKGVDSTDRISKAILGAGAKLVIKEKISTHGKQYAKTSFEVDMNGEGSRANLISRSVAKDESKQLFVSKISGNAACYGHSECDAIIMDNACVSATPEITANNIEASLIHEAAIGKIAGEQIIKLMTLGLSETEAEAQIIEGFLK